MIAQEPKNQTDCLWSCDDKRVCRPGGEAALSGTGVSCVPRTEHLEAFWRSTYCDCTGLLWEWSLSFIKEMRRTIKILLTQA